MSVVNSLSLSPDGQTVASGSDDGIIKLWKVKTDQATSTLKGDELSITMFEISPDGQTVASGDR